MRRRQATDVSVQRIPLRDVYARVSTAGRPGQRAFVLIPGIGVSADYFERLALALNEFGPVHALDLPGFGGVPHPRGRHLTIGEYADLVGHVINELGLDDPLVVGHSMGAQIVTDLAARYRQGDDRPLSDVVLISPVINPHERRLRTAAWRFLQASLREPPRVAAMAVYAYLLCGPRWFWRVLPEMMRYPIEDALPHVPSTALLLTGERDPLCPREWTREACALLPRGQAYEIAGAGHSVMHANADDVARLCVRQARGELVSDGDRIHLIDHPRKVDDPSASNVVQEALGRANELWGILTDDDERIARGKTLHAQAEAEAQARADSGGPDSDAPGS